MKQMPLALPHQFAERQKPMPTAAEYESLARVRLSQNFILRDFLFSTECAARGLTNFPEDPEHVVMAGKALCEKVLEPVLAKWGRFAITFGYQSREGVEFKWSKAMREAKGRNSNPHQWDRKTWGDEIYARIDITPYCVQDGLVDKHTVGEWLMHNLDIDLLMQWRKSNGYCISISPKPRRVWFIWGDPQKGEPRREVFMGAHYWNRIFPTLPQDQRPKFSPSATGGRITWRGRF